MRRVMSTPQRLGAEVRSQIKRTSNANLPGQLLKVRIQAHAGWWPAWTEITCSQHLSEIEHSRANSTVVGNWASPFISGFLRALHKMMIKGSRLKRPPGAAM